MHYLGMSVKRVLSLPPQASSRAEFPDARPAHPLPRPLAALRVNECRYCLADAPEGQMHRALFCAAPAHGGPYCPEHARLCRLPCPDDVEVLAAEIEAALAPRN